MKLIDADALCEDLIERWNLADKRKEELIRAVMADVVAPIVVLQPTIEIVRCKDCKHWRDDHTCREHSLVSPMTANEFCSRAEKRGEA